VDADGWLVLELVGYRSYGVQCDRLHRALPKHERGRNVAFQTVIDVYRN
jgi:hypothetical protein